MREIEKKIVSIVGRKNVRRFIFIISIEEFPKVGLT